MTAAALSYLFVPASRPDRYAKAIASDAHRVVIDLEDGVAVADKAAALGHVIAALEAEPGSDRALAAPVIVRVEGPGTERFEPQLAALAGLSAGARGRLAGIAVPKVDDPAALAHAIAVMRSSAGSGPDAAPREVLAQIESAAGLARVREIAAVPGLTRLAIGAADLSFDLDAELDSVMMDFAYARLVLESRVAGLLGPIASPSFELADLDRVEAGARRLRALGITGQFAVHPAQLSAIHAGFGPTAEQVAWARTIVDTGDGAVRVGEQMVDAPIRDRAERILAQAG
ncbi:hypothetical protein BMH32_07820 [Leucobacter sp. OLJS4]|uniref:HpcH/HpaI aldolase/citrate lyase family protein n=1 Tax=unclassified Leucobacter TaxID=2621730 RepID=UPI000C17F6C5|nr:MULTISPECIES: aldolase/citrate lyase family protein [unclassified Leucobacter]PIJ55637.1 hypothetical protein BMH30_00575 [Leucobacter sp. OLES1]PII82331.1 hypothetical protein BMH25_10635 [Leucobacter sp. OLCALW19]PII87487.1 hypothetical protein BMH26_10170 [Leucobacter sp. OLTLW20]PII94455.1 hypothetical protein BMH27_00230 [Leucobacter sp. OLAS13]PIJ00745.1 hypothetical protein BMH29_01285 [Leucobacter sp. OLDS2]